MKDVSRYAITITPLDSGGKASEEASQTTVRVDVSGGRAQIKELTVRVADSAQLTHGDLLNLDLDILAQAFAPRTPRAGARRAVATAAVPVAAQAPSRPSRRRSPAKTERAYRRMPDPDEVRATYLKSRTITGVATFYDVPTHTAQGWVSRLRRKGIIPAST